jgi:hypothetical protein
MFKKSKQHLRDNDMTYLQHLRFASVYGFKCIIAGCLLIFHSIIPACFSKAGANLTNKLNTVFTDQNEWLKVKDKIEKFNNIYKS